MNPWHLVFPFFLLDGLGIAALIVYGILRFAPQLPLYTRVVASMFASTTLLNSFAQFFPTPYMPWTIILGRITLTLFIIELLRRMHKIQRSLDHWLK